MEYEPGIAKYRQIAEVLKGEIEAGTLKPGDQFPSQAELIKRFGVAQMTVRNAMRLLGDWGLVEFEQGRGGFVRGRAEPPEKEE